MSGTDLSSGLPWVIIDIAAVFVLAIVAIYGIRMWRAKRHSRRPDTIGSVPGPAPIELEGRDDRPVAR
jgi:hypothetical protein